MEKEKSLYHLLVTALFVGILLSFALFYLICAVFDYDAAVADTCFDGTRIEGESFLAKFQRAVYQNEKSLSRIREYNYLAFHSTNDPNIIVGNNDFLFEIQDENGEYSYLGDYLGQLSFTEREHAAILSLLRHRTESYAARGSEYLLVILPNAQTVYSDSMPTYLGDIEQTRRARLSEYLEQNGFQGVLDMTEDLVAYKSEGLLYNNTENSLNSLGLYCTYLSVCAYMEQNFDVSAPTLSYYDFYVHRTAGKSIAQKAGLADVVPNTTVSLADTTLRGYSTVYQSQWATMTALNASDHPLGVVETPPILLQFPGSWEKLQAEPFFSNAFSTVTYQTSWYDDPEAFETASPEIVVQFIYEYQLSALLARDYYS